MEDIKELVRTRIFRVRPQDSASAHHKIEVINTLKDMLSKYLDTPGDVLEFKSRGQDLTTLVEVVSEGHLSEGYFITQVSEDTFRATLKEF